MKGGIRMNDIIGIVWFNDELTYRRALAIFTDSENMPATFEDWKALVGRQREEIKHAGNIAIRADFDPETFIDWCNLRGFQANSSRERRSPSMSCSNIRRPAKERSSNSSFQIYAFAMPLLLHTLLILTTVLTSIRGLNCLALKAGGGSLRKRGTSPFHLARHSLSNDNREDKADAR